MSRPGEALTSSVTPPTSSDGEGSPTTITRSEIPLILLCCEDRRASRHGRGVAYPLPPH